MKAHLKIVLLILIATIFMSGCAGLRSARQKVRDLFVKDPHHDCHCWPPNITPGSFTYSNITSDSATISFQTDSGWNAPTPINNGGTGQVRYSTNASDLANPYPNTSGTLYPNVSYTTLSMETSHSIQLTGLTPNTVYYVSPESWAQTSPGVWFSKPHQCEGWGTGVDTISFTTLPVGAVYSISGYCQNQSANGIQSVTVTLSGDASDTYNTTSSGYYEFTNLSAGNYVVTPSITGITFSPTSRTHNSLSSDLTDQNFTGTTYSISGTIQDNLTNPLQGVTVTLSGSASNSVDTNSSGYFEFTNLASGNYTITPSESGYNFSPTNYSYTSLSSDQSNQDFTGTPFYYINGYIRDGASDPVENVEVVLSGDSSDSYVTTVSGYYYFTNLDQGNYTITPNTASGYTYVPVNRSYSPLNTNQADQDYVATGSAVGPTGIVISNVQSSNIGSVSATVTWDTDVPATSQVEYGLSTSYDQITTEDSNEITSHSVQLTGLTPETLYHYRVISSSTNSTAYSTDYTFTTAEDTTITSITISEVEASEIQENTVMISWRTDVPSTSQVEYGRDSTYGSLSGESSSLVNIHNIRLYNLRSDTIYHYRVISSTSSDAVYYSDNYTFSTAAPSNGFTEINPLVEESKTVTYPNPCKTRTNFCITLNEPVDSIVICIYSLSGKKVKEIKREGSEFSLGMNQIYWDLEDETGNRIGNGLYVYQIKVKKGFVEEKIRRANLMVIR